MMNRDVLREGGEQGKNQYKSHGDFVNPPLVLVISKSLAILVIKALVKQVHQDQI